MYPRFKPLVAAIACAISTSSYGQTTSGEEAGAIIVTASRFSESDKHVPANVSVITRKDIERSPARDIPDLLKTQTGVNVRSLYGSMGIDATVDIRGMGESAGSNTLILLDGQRMNPVDLGSIKWETIPLSAVQQIEIIRGSGSVLYGDRASSGVINIITDKSNKTKASARLEAGSFGFGSLDASISGGSGDLYGNLYANTAHTDGWRNNSDADRASLSGRVAYRLGQGEVFIDAATYRQDYGLPSSINKIQFENDPKKASTPNARMTRDGYRVRPGVSWQLGQNIQLEVDGSFVEDNLHVRYPSAFFPYRNQQETQSKTFSPKIRWSHGLPFAASSDTVVGFDYFDGKTTSDDLDFNSRARTNRQTATLTNTGIYAQNTSTWSNGLDLTLGIREQHFEQEVADQGAKLRDSARDNLTAWESGLGYQFMDGLRGYVKVARNFRLANTDELFAYDPVTFNKIFNGTLKPQTGHLREAGITWKTANFKQQFSLFQQDNENEIGYISANGKNANLDPLRRQGGEAESTWRPATDWLIRLALTYTDARFTDGQYSGKWVPLVPNHQEALTTQWDGGKIGVHSAVLNNVGERYFGGDFKNTREKLGAYTTLDYQAAWSFRPATLALRITNLTNTKYAATGFSGSYYPSDPRAAYLSVRVDF